MKTTEPTPIYRKDYRPSNYLIDTVTLHFDLGEASTTVRSALSIHKNPELADTDCDNTLVLDGEDLELLEIAVDGQVLPESAYTRSETELRIENLPERFVLTCAVKIHPEQNTKLSGLYKSSGNFCTQCEAEGFRRITYFLDRPDVMARYTTTIVADPSRYPVMLSNGNRIAAKKLEDGRQEVTWQDPHPKPCYLFALVAGNLGCLRDEFTTKSGNKVALEIWAPESDLRSCEHAMQSLKDSMAWDEKRYGLEYDLDIYMIVAVSDFNMGAMENKGLNVFNTKCVLARPDSATDDDFENVARVIAHEYFHNWTGNRVTCRDWFQLTLKEGLTVFRDSQFTADHGSPAVKRIGDVKILRRLQFPEDAGPMAHPIRPESYIEMNNFYTVTVYEKGSEIIGMYHTLLGEEGFRKGMDLYFERHDGQAVTCDDFRAAMADANGVNLDQFERWYSDSGTPILEARGRYDQAQQQYTLSLRQSGPDFQGPSGTQNYRARHIPVLLGLLDPSGQDLILDNASLPAGVRPTASNGNYLLELTQLEQEFVFQKVEKTVIPSILRAFSAPVRLSAELSEAELAFLMAHDSDDFNRWDAGQRLGTQVLLQLVSDIQNKRPLKMPEQFKAAFERVLNDEQADPSLRALALLLPEEGQLGQEMGQVDPDAIHLARNFLRQELAQSFAPQWQKLYQDLNRAEPYRAQPEDIGRRRLKNVALHYLCIGDAQRGAEIAYAQYESSDNMTDTQAALSELLLLDREATQKALAHFHQRYAGEALVIDKWFALQAGAGHPKALEAALRLVAHPEFSQKNPNRFRSVIGNLGRNQVAFHQKDGRGYELVASQVLAADAINPQIAARTVSAFNSWRRFDPERQALMLTQLRRMADHPGLSKDLYEIVNKNLAQAED